MVQDVAGAAAVQVLPEERSVAVYPVMGEPPSLDGAAQLTTAELSAPVAETIVGVPGRPTAVADPLPELPVPTEFVAVTAMA